MLEIRLSCENCSMPLPNDSPLAMICTFVCTFCKECVETVLQNVCPNCGGGFENRPTRPKEKLEKYPTSKEIIYNPVEKNQYLEKNKNINPRKR